MSITECPHCHEPLDPHEESDDCEHCGKNIHRPPHPQPEVDGGLGLSPEEQAAIMDAAWKTIQPWMTTKVGGITFVDDDGERRMSVTLPVISDDAPAEIKHLERVYVDIIDSGGFLIGGRK